MEQQPKKKRSGPPSKLFKGVSQYKSTGLFEGHVWVRSKGNTRGYQRHLGSFSDARTAAHVFDLATIKLRGIDDAELNFDKKRYKDDPFLAKHNKITSDDEFLSLLRQEFAIPSQNNKQHRPIKKTPQRAKKVSTTAPSSKAKPPSSPLRDHKPVSMNTRRRITIHTVQASLLDRDEEMDDYDDAHFAIQHQQQQQQPHAFHMNNQPFSPATTTLPSSASMHNNNNYNNYDNNTNHHQALNQNNAIPSNSPAINMNEYTTQLNNLNSILMHLHGTPPPPPHHHHHQTAVISSTTTTTMMTAAATNNDVPVMLDGVDAVLHQNGVVDDAMLWSSCGFIDNNDHQPFDWEII